MFKSICRGVAALVPGSVANLAADKRKYERQLLAKGYSRSHAAAVVAEHFKSKSILQSK